MTAERRDLRRPTGARWAATLALAAACDAPLVLAPPNDVQAQSAIVVLRGSGAGDGAWASAVDVGWSLRVPGDGGGQLTLIYYPHPLAELGLTAGAIALDGGGPCARRAPSSVWHAAVDAPSFQRGELSPDVAEGLVADGAARCGRCETFTELRATLPRGRYRAITAALAPDGRLVAIHPEGGMLSVDRAAVDVIPGCPGVGAYAHIVRLQGDRYVAATARGDVELFEVSHGSCTVIEQRSTTSTRALGWIDAAPDGSEVVAIDVGGGVHLGGATGPLTSLTRLPITPGRTLAAGSDRGDVAWLGPGRFAISAGAPQVTWVDNGQVTRHDRLPTTVEPNAISEIAPYPGGIYVGDALGRVVRITDDGEATMFENAETAGAAIGNVLPDRDGWRVTSAWGLLSAWYPGSGWCASHPIVGIQERGENALTVPEGVVLTDMVGDVSRPGQIVWLSVVAR